MGVVPFSGKAKAEVTYPSPTVLTCKCLIICFLGLEVKWELANQNKRRRANRMVPLHSHEHDHSHFVSFRKLYNLLFLNENDMCMSEELSHFRV